MYVKILSMTLAANSPSETQANARLARLSYYADLFWIVANILFFATWIKFKKQAFSPSFLLQGFCNQNPDDIPWTTQRECFRLDMSAAISIATLGIACRLPVNRATMLAWGNAVLYPVAHGLAHLAVYSGVLPPDQNIEQPMEIASFAVILLMGPAGVYSNLKKTHWTTINSLVVCAILEALMVLVFLEFFRKGVYALLYINVSINLVLMGSRLLLFGPDAVEERLKVFGPNVYGLIAAITMVILVMWIEPTQCDAWFANMGGHVWFDVALNLMGAVAFLNVVHSDSAATKVHFY